ncbi:RICIN domain-containing protein [Streptomyces sp. NPDC003077]|uniref:RICIN domain-containing protein n=1 Tax=Streptomyces sp. NPDC003077 TaxID=3154443 RepID=UPI0033B4B6E1
MSQFLSRHGAAARLSAVVAAAGGLLAGAAVLAPSAAAETDPIPVPPHRGVAVRLTSSPDLVLDVAGSTTDNRAGVNVQHYTGANDQLWLAVPKGGSQFELRNVHSRKCLDVRGDSSEANAELIQYDCHNGRNQLWRAVASGKGYQLISGAGLCVDVFDEKIHEPAAGEKVVQFTCSNPVGNDQRWSFDSR